MLGGVLMSFGTTWVMAGYSEFECLEQDVGKVAAMTSRYSYDNPQIYYLSSDKNNPTLFMESPNYFVTCLGPKEWTTKYLLEADLDENTTFQIKDEEGNYYGNHMNKNDQFDCRGVQGVRSPGLCPDGVNNIGQYHGGMGFRSDIPYGKLFEYIVTKNGKTTTYYMKWVTPVQLKVKIKGKSNFYQMQLSLKKEACENPRVVEACKLQSNPECPIECQPQNSWSPIYPLPERVESESSENMSVFALNSNNLLKKSGRYKLQIQWQLQSEEREFVVDGSQHEISLDFDFSKSVFTQWRWGEDWVSYHQSVAFGTPKEDVAKLLPKKLLLSYQEQWEQLKEIEFPITKRISNNYDPVRPNEPYVFEPVIGYDQEKFVLSDSVKYQLKINIFVVPEVEFIKRGEKYYFNTKSEAVEYFKTLVWEAKANEWGNLLSEDKPVIALPFKVANVGKKTEVIFSSNIKKRTEWSVGWDTADENWNLVMKWTWEADKVNDDHAFFLSPWDQIDTNFTEGVFTLTMGDKKLTYNVKNPKAFVTLTLMDGNEEISKNPVLKGAKLQNLPTPTKTGKRFTGWTTDKEGNKTYKDEKVETDTTLYAQWKRKNIQPTIISWGNGGGSQSTITNDKTTKESKKTEEKKSEEGKEKKSERDQNIAHLLASKDVNHIFSGAFDAAEGNQLRQNELREMHHSLVNEKNEELGKAYLYSYLRGITTQPTIQQADLHRGLTRAEMAKMMSVFAVNVLGKSPVLTETADYKDINEVNGDLPGYIQQAYQLQIMGIDAKGTPIANFNPNAQVTRAEFATVLSRVLYGDKYNQEGADFAAKHLEALKVASILKDTTPTMKELRGWVMLMLMRAEGVK